MNSIRHYRQRVAAQALVQTHTGQHGARSEPRSFYLPVILPSQSQSYVVKCALRIIIRYFVRLSAVPSSPDLKEQDSVIEMPHFSRYSPQYPFSHYPLLQKQWSVGVMIRGAGESVINIRRCSTFETQLRSPAAMPTGRPTASEAFVYATDVYL